MRSKLRQAAEYRVPKSLQSSERGFDSYLPCRDKPDSRARCRGVTITLRSGVYKRTCSSNVYIYRDVRRRERGEAVS
jgi:hypothetical protein